MGGPNLARLDERMIIVTYTSMMVLKVYVCCFVWMYMVLYGNIDEYMLIFMQNEY